MVFPTPLLDQALAQRQQLYEQQRQVTLSRVQRWLAEVGSDYGIETAYLFGSLICPYRFTPHSDVDVAVEAIHADAFFRALSALSEAVERPVDLVELGKCPFAERIRQQGLLWKQQP
jgi:uncharacterized protein